MNTTRFCWQLIVCFFLSIIRLLPWWPSPYWGARFFGHYLRLVCFLASIIYIGMSGVIIGFVGAYFTFKFLPYSHYTRPLITEEVLAALGYCFYRIVIPILSAILIAARCTAAVTSDLSNRVYLQEIDAMKSLGASPSAYLQTSIMYAFLIGVPFLTFIAFLLARMICITTFIVMHPQTNLLVADSIFHSLLRQGDSIFFKGTHWVIYKQLVCGFGLANICYFIGTRPKSSTRHISRDITLTIIWGTLFVLFTHLMFALFEF